MIDPHHKSRVFHMAFESVLRHPLDPLKVNRLTLFSQYFWKQRVCIPARLLLKCPILLQIFLLGLLRGTGLPTVYS